MSNKAFPTWFVVLLIAVLSVLVTPVTAQTTPEATEASILFPLADPGPYAIGVHVMHLTDASRSGRELDVDVWYPAVIPANPTDIQTKNLNLFHAWQDAAPDPQAAPYPLILESLASNGYEVPQLYSLASHGFVVAKMAIQPNDDVVMTMVDRPLDILFMLNQLTAANQSDFGGVIDSDHVGIIGFSFGAYTTLALTGARINPASASDFINGSWNSGDWDILAAYRATLSPPLTSDALWPPFTDSRIRAAVLFSACDTAMFGEQGLAAATVPALIVGGTSDSTCSYTYNDVNAFTHIGSQDRYLVSVVGSDHGGGINQDEAIPVSTQLYAAFFDLYLKGKQDEAKYLTADYVNSVEAQLKLGFVWGAYNGG